MGSCGAAYQQASSVQEFESICKRECSMLAVDSCLAAGQLAFCTVKECKPSGCSKFEACSTEVTSDEKCPDGQPKQGGLCEKSMAPPSAPLPPQKPDLGVSQKKVNPSQVGTETSQPAAASSSDPQYALQQCDQARQMAEKCCYNPESCISTSQYNYNQLAQLQAAQRQGSKSLQDYCRQMQTAGGLGNQQAESAAGVCYKNYSSCQTTCGQLAQQNPSVSSQLGDMANRCAQLSSRLSLIGNQMINNNDASGYSRYCQNATQAQPQSLSKSEENSSQGRQDLWSQNSAEDCLRNPSSANCKSNQAIKQTSGEASFDSSRSDSKINSGAFNVSESTSSYGSLMPSQVEGVPVKTGTVANNSGGGIPGGGSSGANPSLGTRARGGSPGSPGYTTDVLQGLSSPTGYSATYSHNDSDSGEGSGGRQGDSGSRAPSNAEGQGLDLKQYLPGGTRNPLGRGVGGRNLLYGEINGKHVNIWNRISVRMQEKCRLGVLVDCR